MPEDASSVVSFTPPVCYTPTPSALRTSSSLMGSPAPMVQAYRLVYPPHSSAPPQLWEWQQPWMDHLVWNAATFGRQVELRAFRTWEALERANTRLWETAYRPRAAYALWPTWLAWLAEYRELLITTKEIYEAHHV